MTLQEREMYVAIIKKLYGNSIYVDESQITQEVVEIVEKILKETRSCSMNLGIFTSIVQGVADGLQAAGETILFNAVHDMLVDPSYSWVSAMKASFGEAFVQTFIITWVDILTGNKQSIICLNTAKLNWKSALAIALLGI